MAKEWIDVIDTAIKIGLGGLITGTFTYFGLKFSHKSEKEKYMLETKTKLLEQITKEIEDYFQAWDFYVSKIAGITKHLKNKNKDSNDLSDIQKKHIKEKNDMLVDSWAKRESAKSKLILLKATSTVQALKDCRKQEKELRDKIIFDKDIPDYEEIQEYRKYKTKLQEKVHNELANLYEALGT